MSIPRSNVKSEEVSTTSSHTSSSCCECSSICTSCDSTYHEYLADGYPFEWGSWVFLRNPVTNHSMLGIVVGVTRCGYIRVQLDRKRATIVRRLPKNLILYHYSGCSETYYLIGHGDDADLIGKVFHCY